MCKPVEANVTNLNNTIRLTDELERQLMLQAIEEQFRPHPMRALAAGLRKLATASAPWLARRARRTRTRPPERRWAPAGRTDFPLGAAALL